MSKYRVIYTEIKYRDFNKKSTFNKFINEEKYEQIMRIAEFRDGNWHLIPLMPKNDILEDTL